MSYQYVFKFTPMDSFMFSGETSVRTKDGKADDFFEHDNYKSRRQSFVVRTEKMPPQTTVMGAVRHYIVKNVADGINKIGCHSFNPASPSSEMGSIEKISAVGIMGTYNNKTMLCIPSPEDNLYSSGNSGAYQPMTKEEYNPKEYPRYGFFLYPMNINDKKQYVINKNQAAEWQITDKFFKTYTQPLYHVPEDGKPRSSEGNYHMQQRCKLMDAGVAGGESAVLSDPGFCVFVSLTDEIDNAPKMLLSLGGRDSMFMLSVEPSQVNVEGLLPTVGPRREQDYRVALISPARLPEEWLKSEGMVQAFVSTRPLRCAVTVDDRYKLQLIKERLTFADIGSVFIFDSKDARDEFRKNLTDSALCVCGFNQTICY